MTFVCHSKIEQPVKGYIFFRKPLETNVSPDYSMSWQSLDPEFRPLSKAISQSIFNRFFWGIHR